MTADHHPRHPPFSNFPGRTRETDSTAAGPNGPYNAHEERAAAPGLHVWADHVCAAKPCLVVRSVGPAVQPAPPRREE